MAKKGKQRAQAPNPSAIPNADQAHRINFMYQAAAYFSTLPPSAAEAAEAEGESAGEPSSSTLAVCAQGDDSWRARRPRRSKERTKEVSPFALGTSMARSIREVAQKVVMRVDPSIKRSICKRCQTVLIPGLTSSVRVLPSKAHAHWIYQTCHTCSYRRRLPAPPTSQDPLATSLSGQLASSSDVELLCREAREKERRRGVSAGKKEAHGRAHGHAGEEGRGKQGGPEEEGRGMDIDVGIASVSLPGPHSSSDPLQATQPPPPVPRASIAPAPAPTPAPTPTSTPTATAATAATAEPSAAPKKLSQRARRRAHRRAARLRAKHLREVAKLRRMARRSATRDGEGEGEGESEGEGEGGGEGGGEKA